MKRLIFLLTLLFPIYAMANVYHVATDSSGDFTTIAQVNAATFVAGDSVLFRRGDTWREQLIPDSGSASGYITYGAYGTGAKPLILGSKQENVLTDWVDLGSNIWSNNDVSFTGDVGNIIFDNESSCGVKVATEAELLTQDYLWYDATNDLIKVYSVGNPASIHSNIECARKGDIIDGNPSYIIIDGLDIRYGGSHGMGFSSNTDNIIIRNCHLSYIGGSYQTGTIRYGNGIEFWENSTNILVENNWIEQVFDEGITNQGTSNFVQDNITIRNNILIKCNNGYATGIFTDGTIQNLYLYHNTILLSSGSWANIQKVGNPSQCILIKGNVLKNINIKNNILYDIADRELTVNSINYIEVHSDYNSIFTTSAGHPVIWTDVGWWTMAEFAAYQLATSQDLHSIASDPLLASNYRPLVGSPAIGAGISVGVDTDFYGHTRIGQVDIGAVEAGNYLNNCTIKNGTFR